MTSMSAPLYNKDILRLATAIPHQRRLADAQASVEKRSPVCGSRVIVDYIRRGGAPPGQSGAMLAKAIRAAGGARPTELFAPNVLQKAPNSSTLLESTLQQTAEALGGKVTGVSHGTDAGKHWIRITVGY